VSPVRRCVVGWDISIQDRAAEQLTGADAAHSAAPLSSMACVPDMAQS
jgi:hypothetical protein